MQVEITEADGAVKVIGELRDGTFLKRVKKSKHLFKKLDAWGIDADTFKTMLRITANQILVFDIENDILYKTSVADFEKHGVFLHFKPHRAQIFLPREKWEKIKCT